MSLAAQICYISSSWTDKNESLSPGFLPPTEARGPAYSISLKRPTRGPCCSILHDLNSSDQIGSMASAGAGSRGQNFNHAELRQLATSWVNISTCSIVGNAQKNSSFWDRVAVHYNRNRPSTTQERGGRSLESKWSEVKHDVAKFSGAYANVEDLRISGSSVEDTLVKARELYVQKHPKSKAFAFEDCWTLLKECPKWAQCVDDMATKANSRGGEKRKVQQAVPQPEDQMPGSPTEIVDHGTDHGGDSVMGGNDISSNWQHRPIGNKSAKKARSEECAFKISANATRSMAATNERRTLILETQSIQSLFSQKAIDVDEEIREDFRRNRMREVLKLRRRLDLADAQDAAQESRRAPIVNEAQADKSPTFVPPSPQQNTTVEEPRAASPTVFVPPANSIFQDLGVEFAAQEADLDSS